MVEPVWEWIGGNSNTLLVYRKKDQVGTVEKGLIVEVQYREEEELSADQFQIIENFTP